MPMLRAVPGALLPTTLALHCLFAAALAAQSGDEAAHPAALPRPVAQATRVETALKLDGRLDEEAWSKAVPVTGFMQHEPFEGRSPTERTEVRILFDAQALYIGARLYDSNPTGIVHGEMRRDAELKDQDAFVVMLDRFWTGKTVSSSGPLPPGSSTTGR